MDDPDFCYQVCRYFQNRRFRREVRPSFNGTDAGFHGRDWTNTSMLWSGRAAIACLFGGYECWREKETLRKSFKHCAYATSSRSDSASVDCAPGTNLIAPRRVVIQLAKKIAIDPPHYSLILVIYGVANRR